MGRPKKSKDKPAEGKTTYYTTDKTLKEYLENPRDTRTEGWKRMWYYILKDKSNR